MSPQPLRGLPATVGGARYDSRTQRFAVIDGGCTSLQLFDRVSGELLGAAPLDRCAYDLVMRGPDLAWSQPDGVWHWRHPAPPRRLLDLVQQPDGKPEEQSVKMISPDGQHVLLLSSRHRANRIGLWSGVSHTGYDTYLLGVADSSLRRVELPGVTAWEGPPGAPDLD